MGGQAAALGHRHHHDGASGRGRSACQHPHADGGRGRSGDQRRHHPAAEPLRTRRGGLVRPVAGHGCVLPGPGPAPARVEPDHAQQRAHPVRAGSQRESSGGHAAVPASSRLGTLLQLGNGRGGAHRAGSCRCRRWLAQAAARVHGVASGCGTGSDRADQRWRHRADRQRCSCGAEERPFAQPARRQRADLGTGPETVAPVGERSPGSRLGRLHRRGSWPSSGTTLVGDRPRLRPQPRLVRHGPRRRERLESPQPGLRQRNYPGRNPRPTAARRAPAPCSNRLGKPDQERVGRDRERRRG